jgi:hypothetical protein
MFILRPKHDKIQAWWPSSISSKNMLEKVWWCKYFKMESWTWTICYWINCLKVVVKDHMSFWNVVGKGRCCYQFTLRFQGRDIGRHEPNRYDWSYKGLIP